MRTFVIIIALILQAIFTQPALSSEPKRSKEEVIFNSNIEQINAEIEAVLSGMREFRKNKDTKQEDGTITTTATRSSEHSRESLFY